MKAMRSFLCMLALVALAAACVTNEDPVESGTPETSAAPGTTFAPETGDPMSDARALIERAYTGTFHQPPSTGPAAVESKKIWIISCFQVIDSCRLPSEGAAGAAEILGWDATVVDGQFTTSVQGDAIAQAAGAGADAVVLVGIDCQTVQGPLAAARAKGVTTVGLFSFDCDDPALEHPGDALFDIVPTVAGAGPGESATLYGRIKAAYAIVASEGKAVVIDQVSPTALVLGYLSRGFQEQLSTCPDCRLVETIAFTNDDILGGRHKDNLAAVLQQHPDVDTIQVPIDPLFQLSVLSVTGPSTKLKLLGGEGLPANIDLIRGGQQTMALAVAHEWAGWSAMDMINRHFAGEDPTHIDEGIGFQLVDADHNLPDAGPYVPLDEDGKPIDYRAAYRAVWGR